MKICLLADLHFGVKHNDGVFLENQLSFLRSLKEELKNRNIVDIIILGDIFDNRYELDISTINKVFDLISRDFADFHIKMIVGNHDTYYKNTAEVNSLKIFQDLINVEVFDKPLLYHSFYNRDVLFLPWITDYTKTSDILDSYLTDRVPICFAHLDILDSMMDKYRVSENGISLKLLSKYFDHVYTGHYHKRSHLISDSITADYIGSPYELTMIDENEPKGAGILDLENLELTYISNTISSKFKTLLYPHEFSMNDIRSNYVKVKIRNEYENDIAKISEYKAKIMEYKPAKLLNDEYENTEIIDFDLSEISNFDLLDISLKYIEDSNLNHKEETIAKFRDLYNKYV